MMSKAPLVDGGRVLGVSLPQLKQGKNHHIIDHYSRRPRRIPAMVGAADITTRCQSLSATPPTHTYGINITRI
jgi:hypothetical protein